MNAVSPAHSDFRFRSTWVAVLRNHCIDASEGTEGDAGPESQLAEDTVQERTQASAAPPVHPPEKPDITSAALTVLGVVGLLSLLLPVVIHMNAVRDRALAAAKDSAEESVSAFHLFANDWSTMYVGSVAGCFTLSALLFRLVRRDGRRLDSTVSGTLKITAFAYAGIGMVHAIAAGFDAKVLALGTESFTVMWIDFCVIFVAGVGLTLWAAPRAGSGKSGQAE
jgi:hypothetical protein